MKGFPVTVTFDLRWGEMDALGHANNVNFFRWFEVARLTYFERLAIPMSEGAGPILAHTSCDYLRPLVYPARLVAGARMEKLGRTSFTIEHALAQADTPDDHIARGKAVIVMVNYGSGEKSPLTEEMRQAVERVETPARTA